MKKTIILASFLLISLTVFAQLSFKAGGLAILNKNSSKDNSYVSVSYEFKHKKNAIEVEAGYYNVLLKGEEYLGYNTPQGSWVYGNNQVRGRLHNFPITLTYKRYFGKWYAGAGAGYTIHKFQRFFDDVAGWTNGEYYTGKPICRNQGLWRGVVGYDINERWSIEGIFTKQDLNIESGVAKIGVAEDDSNLNSVMVLMRYKF